jgi:hypothetical protein
MATIRSKKSSLRPDKAAEYAAAVKAAHEYQKQRKVMFNMLIGFEPTGNIDDERLKQETFERIKSFDDGSDKRKGKGRK